MKPKLFVASSSEGLPVARAIHHDLRTDCEVVVWEHGIFELSKTMLDSLLDEIAKTDFAIAVFTPDDILRIRGETQNAARDNVVFELGLFFGRLGRDRTFMVLPESNQDFRVPTDLGGLAFGIYEDNRRDDNLRSAVGPFCDEVRARIEKINVSAEREEEGKRLDEHFITVVPEATRRAGSSEFYREFNKHLRATSRSIVMTGSGFHCSDKKGTRLAENYLRVLTGCALRHSLVRIELADSSLRKWGDLLTRHLAPMKNVEILVPKESTRDDFLLKDLCLMDPDTDKAVVEMMFPAYKISPTASSEIEVVGEGIFIRSRKIASSFQKLIYMMRQKGRFVAMGVDELREFFNLPPLDYDEEEGQDYYFAFGSNMLEAQMKDRVARSELLGPARLEGFRLAFDIQGTIFPSSVANLVESPGDHVWGALYRVHVGELRSRMDFYEGVGHGEYTRQKVEVVGPGGKPVQAFLYRSSREADEARPERVYLDIMLKGARALGLPDSYLAHLETYRPQV